MQERGDIILDGLLRMVAGLVLTALLVFEVGAVVVNRVQVDGAAQEAARAGARTWETSGSEARTESTVHEVAGKLPGAVVREWSVDGDVVQVTVSREAPVLLIDRVEPLRPRLEGEATFRVPTDR